MNKKKNTKQVMRLFVDMDGVIAKWNKGKTMEEVFAPNYFLTLDPEDKLIKCLRCLITEDIFELHILSVASGEHVRECKLKWLEIHFPQMPKENIIFVEAGENKSDAIKDKRDTDILLDDYSHNLHKWHGIGLKFLNGINGTNGTWEGPVLRKTMLLTDMIHYFRYISQLENTTPLLSEKIMLLLESFSQVYPITLEQLEKIQKKAQKEICLLSVL